jgi:tRNA G18 (ribose-2'-O)-methylase SpoU
MEVQDDKKPMVTMTTVPPQVPKMYLVLTNISKRPNVQKLLMTAAAFDCHKILVVGQKNFCFAVRSDNQTNDAIRSDVPSVLQQPIALGKLSIERYDKWEDCVQFLKRHNIRLVGVEIHQNARSIEEYFDYQDTAFIMGNEGTGLNEKHMASCDAFVRIPQFGGGTASLNVYVACSIIMYRYHYWQRQGQNTLTMASDCS